MIQHHSPTAREIMARDATGPGPVPPGGTDRSQLADLHVLSRERNGVPEACDYGNVGDLLAGGTPKPPVPDVCRRRDKIGLFYRGQVNNVFGDPESGKTLLCDYATVEILKGDGRVLRLDMDHNGIESTVSRLIGFGAKKEHLVDVGRFLYAEPDKASLMWIVEHMSKWKPDLVVVDSVGELVSLFGADSNSADDFTRIHTDVLKALAKTGAAVVLIDHLSKGTDSRSYGATGTAAKKRAIGGTSIRVKVDDPFTPGKGGSAFLTIHKDRHGGLRGNSPAPTGGKEPMAGKFLILGNVCSISAPLVGERTPGEQAPPADVDAVADLDPKPSSVEDARSRLKWRKERATKAYHAWKERSVGE